MTATERRRRVAEGDGMTIADIILRMTTNDERFNHLVWVGKELQQG